MIRCRIKRFSFVLFNYYIKTSFVDLPQYLVEGVWVGNLIDLNYSNQFNQPKLLCHYKHHRMLFSRHHTSSSWIQMIILHVILPMCGIMNHVVRYTSNQINYKTTAFHIMLCDFSYISYRFKLFLSLEFSHKVNQNICEKN